MARKSVAQTVKGLKIDTSYGEHSSDDDHDHYSSYTHSQKESARGGLPAALQQELGKFKKPSDCV